MKEIVLTRGMVAFVDDADYEALTAFKWHAVKTAPETFYAARSVWNGETKKKKMVLMHREIMNAPEGTDVDHENRIRLDNRRDNLRLCSRSKNLAAKPTLSTWCGRSKTSPFRGVAWAKDAEKWTAQISVDNKKKHLGCFEDPADAARAYDIAARGLHGNFAVLNFPLTKTTT